MVGESCFKELFEKDSLARVGASVLWEFDSSAWNYLASDVKKLANIENKDIVRVFLKKKPASCARLDSSTLKSFKMIVIPKACVQAIPRSVIDQLTLEELYLAAKLSPELFSYLSSRLQPFTKVMKEVYDNYKKGIKSKKFASSNFDDFKRSPSVAASFSLLVDFLNQEVPLDKETKFASTCQLVGGSIMNGALKIYDNLLDLDYASPLVTCSVIANYVREILAGDALLEKSAIETIMKQFGDIYFSSAVRVFLDEKNEESWSEVVALIYADFLRNLIQGLPQGSSVVLQHGFSTSHLTIAEFQMTSTDEIIFRYYNAGLGLDYHTSFVNPSDSLEVKRSHKISFQIPEAELSLQFWNFFVNTQCFFKKDSSRWEHDEVYEGLLGMIPPEYLIKNFGPHDVFITPQLNGNSSFSSIFTWMRTKFSSEEEFKYFLLALKQFAFKRAMADQQLEIKNHRRGVDTFISLADEIEREAEALMSIAKFKSSALQLGKSTNDSKKYLFELLVTSRYKPASTFSTLRIEEESLDGNELFIRNALDDSRLALSYVESHSVTSLELSSFSKNIKILLDLYDGAYKSVNFLNFILEIAVGWDMKNGEEMPTDTAEQLDLMKNLIQLIKNIRNSLDYYSSDETILTIRLLGIQLWFTLIALKPKVANFRPKLEPLTMHCATDFKYIQVMAETAKWDVGKKALDFFTNFSLSGDSVSEDADNLTKFADIFFNERPYKKCGGMSSRMIKMKYNRSPLVLAKYCEKFLIDLPGHYGFSFVFHDIINIFMNLQNDFSSPSNSFVDKQKGYFAFSKSSYSGKSVRFDSEIYSIKSNDYKKYSLNEIMSAQIGYYSYSGMDSLSIKVKKQGHALYKLNYYTRHFMLIVFLARRPELFRRLDVINMFFQAIYPLETNDIWHLNSNLSAAWFNALNFIFKYHAIQYGATKSTIALDAMQNVILFSLNLIHSQTSDTVLRFQFSNHLEPFLNAYRDLYSSNEKVEGKVIEPSYFFSFSAFLRNDFVSFAAHYLATKMHFRRYINFYRRIDLQRIFQNVFGMALKQFYEDATVAQIRKVALEASKLTGGICKNCGSFESLKGTFPQYSDENGCFIDLMEKIFLPTKTAFAFRPEYVQSISSFCDYDKFFGKMGNDLKMTIENANYEFIKTGSLKYRLARIEAGSFFVHMPTTEMYFKYKISPKIYSLWCSEDSCLLYKFSRDTLKTELVAQFAENGKVSLRSVDYKYSKEKSIISNYFPSNYCLGYSNQAGEKEYHILHYLDPDGKQLRIREESGMLYVGTDKKYSAKIEDLKSRKNFIYRLDLMGFLVVSDSQGNKFAFLPKIPADFLGCYSKHHGWIGLHNSISFYEIESGFGSYFIPIDNNGYLSPTSRAELILVAFFYLVSGEYEMSMNYLKGVHHTTAFTVEESLLLLNLISWSRELPDALSIRVYGIWLLKANERLFNHSIEFSDSKNSRIMSSFANFIRSYLSVKHQVSRNVMLMYCNANPDTTILSEFETEQMKKQFNDMVVFSEIMIYNENNGLLSSYSSGVELFDIDDFSLLVGTVYMPYVPNMTSGSTMSKFLKEKIFVKNDLCRAFKYLFCSPLHLRRIVQEHCYSGVIDTNEIDNSVFTNIAGYYKPKPFQVIFKVLTAVPFYSAVKIPKAQLNYVHIYKAESLSSFENKLLRSIDPNLANFIDEFNDLLAEKEKNVKANCASKISYVEKNICEGDAELIRKDVQRKTLHDFVMGQKFESSKPMIIAAIKEMESKMVFIKNELKAAYGVFDGEATSLLDFSDTSFFLDGFLLKFLRNARVYMFKRYFPKMNQNDVQEKVTKYFALYSLIQRFQRIIDETKNAMESSNASRFLMEKADELIVELSHRVANEPFKFEILLFEKARNLRLRNANLEALHELLGLDENGKERNSVVQRVMGGGKTLVLGTLCLVSAGANRFSILIIPAALLETNAGNTLFINYVSFGQRGHVLFVNRCYANSSSGYQHCIRFYESVYSILQTCLARQEYLMISRESLLSLYNSYKQALIDSHDSLINILGPIMTIIKDHGFAILDEVDSILFPYFELNYPISENESINLVLGRSIISAFKIMLRNKEIKALIDIRKKNSPPMPHSVYLQLTTLLEAQLVNDPHYTSCMQEDVDETSCKKLFNRFLKSTLEDCLASKLNVSYGRMQETHNLESLENSTAILHARPYEGANRESKLSEFSDPVTALTYTLLTYARKSMTTAQKLHFFDVTLKEAEGEFSSLFANSLRDNTVFSKQVTFGTDVTQVGRLFSSYCRFDDALSTYASLPSKFKPLFLRKFCFMRRRSMGFIFSYLEKHVLPTITKTDRQVSSNAQDLFYIFKRFVAYSGTIDNKNVFDSDVRVKPDDIALGTIMSQVVSKQTKVLTIKSNNSLKEIYDLVGTSIPDAKKEIRAFIDVGAVFNEASNRRLVAESIKELGLKGGLYFKTGTDNLHFTDTVGNEVHVKKTDSVSLEEATKLKPDARFTFYDEVHTRGVDIVQGPDSIALVTVRPTTTLSNLLQGILRMRKFFGNQKIIFLIIDDEVASIRNKISKATGDLNALDILHLAYEVQESNGVNENQMILLQKMQTYVNDKIVSDKLSTYYPNLILYHSDELAMMTLKFDDKVLKYWDSMKLFLSRFPEHFLWLKNIYSEWTLKVKERESAKSAMIRNVQKQTQNMKQKEAEKELENQMANIDLKCGFVIKNGYRSLKWDCDETTLFSRIDEYKVSDTSRYEPELVAAVAINGALSTPADCPGNVYLSSNFVQVLESNEPNVSFKLHSSDKHCRRDQLAFFIAVFRDNVSANSFKIVMFEPEEVQDWLKYWRKDEKFEETVLVFTSNGDIVYPNLPEDSICNIFEMFFKKDTSLTWDVEAIVHDVSTASYAIGMHETFSNFFLAEEVAALENAHRFSGSSFLINDLLSDDQEVKTSSILNHVLASTLSKKPKVSIYYRHMHNPNAPLLKYEMSAIEPIDVSENVFMEDVEGSMFFDTETGVSEEPRSEEEEFIAVGGLTEDSAADGTKPNPDGTKPYSTDPTSPTRNIVHVGSASSVCASVLFSLCFALLIVL